jgi:hypothetical protein
MIDLVSFADKYQLDVCRKWALDWILRLTTGSPVLLTLHPSTLAALYYLYHRLQGFHPDRMRTAWYERVSTEELPLSDALDAAEGCGDQTFLTRLYCLHLRRMGEHPSFVTPTPSPADDIAPIHFQRMSAGHAALSLAWIRLRDERIDFPFVAGWCTSELEHATQCLPRWHARWLDAIHAAEDAKPLIVDMDTRVPLLHGYLSNHSARREDGGEWHCFNKFLISNLPWMRRKKFDLVEYFFPSESLAVV